MRDYIAIRRTGRAAGYREFIAAMSRAAKRDMTPFILPWLDGKYIPNVEARVEGSRVILTQEQPDVVFELPLDVALTTPSGTVVRRSVRLTHRADTVDVADVGTVSSVTVDPDHVFLLQRHYGEVVRFTLPFAAAPDAKLVELTGNFSSKPMLATRGDGGWFVELPLTEGRYVWQWRIDGALPNEEATYADVASPSNSAKTGVRWAKPLERLTNPYPR
jgi:hypothetical protein